MQLTRMVNTNMIENSFAMEMTGTLAVKIIASFSWKKMIMKQNKSPTVMEVNIDTVIANFAPFALPAPSSLATRTLCHPRNYDTVHYGRIDK